MVNLRNNPTEIIMEQRGRQEKERAYDLDPEYCSSSGRFHPAFCTKANDYFGQFFDQLRVVSPTMDEAEPTNPELKAMFWRIKFYTDTATELVTGQGINSIEENKTLTQDHVTRLCSIIHKPGEGMNRHAVSESSENIFHLLVYYCQHQKRVTRVTEHYLATLENIRALREQREIKKDWDMK